MAFDSLLTVVSACATSLAAAVNNLAQAPAGLVDSLQKNVPREDLQGGELVHRFCKQVDMFASRARQGESHIEAARQIVLECQQKNAGVRAAFKGRDEAYQTSSHYETKVDSLRDGALHKGTLTQKMSDKLQRNQQKKDDSQRELNNRMGEAHRLATDVIAGKWRHLGEAMAKLCRYYCAIFDGAELMVKELFLLAEEFTQAVAAESQPWARKTQEAAQQARERVAGMASGMGERFQGAMGSAAGYGRGAFGGPGQQQQGGEASPPPAGWRSMAGSLSPGMGSRPAPVAPPQQQQQQSQTSPWGHSFGDVASRASGAAGSRVPWRPGVPTQVLGGGPAQGPQQSPWGSGQYQGPPPDSRGPWGPAGPGAEAADGTGGTPRRSSWSGQGPF